MKKRILLICASLIILFISLSSNNDLPDFYYRYDQMLDDIDSWVDEYPDLVKKVHIGYSQEDNIPIYAVKISDNVHEQEDKPSLLFVGQVHAEEVLGNEIVMKHMQQIINRSQLGLLPYWDWINELQLWFIPTLNPEGLQVVTDGWDTSFRKNKRDNTGSGEFDFVPGPGYDPDGVDLNRNFPFNWVHGDTLFHPGGVEVFDYYRGPGPASESEIQALISLTDEIHFVYSIIWHSSRTGNFSEQVFYSFNWWGHRPSPDFEMNQSIGVNVAQQIPRYGASGHYDPIASSSRTGNAHDWLYQRYGNINLLVETSLIQPDEESVMNTIVDNCILGQKWLINRALNGGDPDISSAMLTGHVRDAVTNEPLQAEIIVEGFHADFFSPRMSDQLYGRYWRPLLPSQGPYNITARKKGYESYTHEGVTIGNSGWRTRNFNLQPLPASTFYGTVHSNGEPLDAEITLFDHLENDVIQVNQGDFLFETHSGSREIWIIAEGYYPYTGIIDIQPGEHSINVNLSPSNILFYEGWEEPNCNWHINGPWEIISENSYSGNAITDSWGGGDKMHYHKFYAPNANVHITTLFPLNLVYLENAYLSFYQHLYTEWDYDFVYVEFSEDGANWDIAYQKSGQHDYWHRVLLNLEDFLGRELFLRFRLTADSPHPRLVDPGWIIDEIELLTGSSQLVSTEQNYLPPVDHASLEQNYPNPFNPITIIRFNIPEDDSEERKILIFNVKGQMVEKIELSTDDVRRGSIVWNASDKSSGIYFYQLRLDSSIISTKKAVLIK